MEIENPMVDANWRDFYADDEKKRKEKDERFFKLADEQYDEEVAGCRN